MRTALPLPGRLSARRQFRCNSPDNQSGQCGVKINRRYNALMPNIVSLPRRVLLVKLSSLGDVVHALPLLESLRAGLGPDVFLGWAVRDAFAPLLFGNPHLSSLYSMQGKSLGAIWALGKTLREAGFDMTLDTQGLLRSGMITRLSGAGRRIGLDLNREGNRLFLTEATVPVTQRIHIVDKLLGFCDVLGVPRLPVRVQTYLAEGEKRVATELLHSKDALPLVGCIVGASTPEKTYPAKQWATVANLLGQSGRRVVLIGGPAEKPAADSIVETSGNADNIINLVGKTPIPVLAAVLAQCGTVIGGDSGPTHLAVAVGARVVGLYGVTDPARTGPQWGAAPAIVLDYAEKDAPPGITPPAPHDLDRCYCPDTPGRGGTGCNQRGRMGKVSFLPVPA